MAAVRDVFLAIMLLAFLVAVVSLFCQWVKSRWQKRQAPAATKKSTLTPLVKMYGTIQAIELLPSSEVNNEGFRSWLVSFTDQPTEKYLLLAGSDLLLQPGMRISFEIELFRSLTEYGEARGIISSFRIID